MPFLFCFLQENTKVFCSLRLDKCRFWKKYQSHDAKSCVAKPWNWERNSCFKCSLTLLCLRVKLLWFLEKSKHRPKRKPKLCCQRLTPPHLEASAMDFSCWTSSEPSWNLMKLFMNKNTVQFFTYDLSRFMLICAFMLSLSVHVFTFLVMKATKTIQRTSMAKTPKKTPHFWPQNQSQNWVSTRNKQPGTLSWEALLRRRPQSVWHNECTSKISEIRVKFASENSESLPKISEKLRFSDVTWIYMMQFTPKKEGQNHVDAAFRWTLYSFSQGAGSFEWMPPANPGTTLPANGDVEICTELYKEPDLFCHFKSTTCWGTAISRKCIF